MVCRSDEPGAWYAMLPLEMVYAFDPIPPEPDEAVPMSRDSTSQDSLGDGDSKPVSNGGSTAAPHLPPDWVLDRKDASNILGGQVRNFLISFPKTFQSQGVTGLQEREEWGLPQIGRTILTRVPTNHVQRTGKPEMCQGGPSKPSPSFWGN